MSHVRSKNTKPELFLRSSLHRMGFRFRIHSKKLPGRPDLTLNKYRAVIFVNGCFWHGHKRCRKATIPVSNRRFWKSKIEKNIMRDRKIHREIRRLGWRVFVVWECQLLKKKDEMVRIVAGRISLF